MFDYIERLQGFNKQSFDIMIKGRLADGFQPKVEEHITLGGQNPLKLRFAYRVQQRFLMYSGQNNIGTILMHLASLHQGLNTLSSTLSPDAGGGFPSGGIHRKQCRFD